MKEFKLTNQAKALLADPDNFILSYGDEFVYSITSGGSLYILFEYATSNREEKTQISHKLSVAARTLKARGSATANFSSDLAEVENLTNSKLKFFGTGISGEFPDLNLDSISTYVKRFPQMVKLNGGSPSVFYVSTMQLRNLGEVTIKPYFEKIFNQKQFISDCERNLSKLYELGGDLNYTLDDINKNQFTQDNIDKAKSKQMELEDKIFQLEKIASRCAYNFSYCNENLSSYIIPAITIERIDGTSDVPTPVQNTAKALIDVPSAHYTLIDSISYTDNFKTVELRGQYGVGGNVHNERYNQEGTGYSNFDITPIGGPQGSVLCDVVIELYDMNSKRLLERISYDKSPIRIERKNIYIGVWVMPKREPENSEWRLNLYKLKSKEGNPLTAISY